MRLLQDLLGWSGSFCLVLNYFYIVCVPQFMLYLFIFQRITRALIELTTLE